MDVSTFDRFIATFFDMRVAWRYLPEILSGVSVTVLVGISVVVTGIATGLVLAAIRAFGIRPINALILFVVDILRVLPPLAIILIVYFGLPSVGIVWPNYIVLWATLSAVLAAFSEEVFWAGITSVGKGQWIAARATGLTLGQTLAYVIIPQAVRLAIPPLTNRTISITKNVALGSAIGVSEILGQATSALTTSANATPLTVGAFLYVLLFTPLVLSSRWLERRYGWKRL